MWMHITQSTNIKEVHHKFLVSGHSFLPNDRDFGVIERANKKRSELYVPDQWYNMISSCRKRDPFKVNKMESSKFYSVESLAEITTNRKIAKDGQKVEWLKIQWMCVKKSDPFTLFFKYNLNDDIDFRWVSFLKTRGLPHKHASVTENLCDHVLKPLCTAPRKLSFEKYSDIQKLLKYLASVHYDFFTDLAHKSKASPGKTTNNLFEDELLNVSEAEDASN